MWMLMVGLLVCGADEGKTEKTPEQTLSKVLSEILAPPASSF